MVGVLCILYPSQSIVKCSLNLVTLSTMMSCCDKHLFNQHHVLIIFLPFVLFVSFSKTISEVGVWSI